MSWQVETIAFVDDSTGWLVRERHDTNRMQILHTTDGGASWGVQYDGRDPIASAAQFIDARHGWVAGNGGGDVCRQEPHPSCQGVVLATADGGETWSHAPVPWAAEDIAFQDARDGWLSGSFGCTGCQNVGVWVDVTSDGGRTWTRRNLVNETAYTLPAARIARTSAEEGWIVASDLALSTSTAWQSWTVLPSPCAGRGHYPLGTGRMLYGQAWDGWLACASQLQSTLTVAIFNTRDSGQSWQPAGTASVTIPPPDVRMAHVEFLDPRAWMADRGQSPVQHYGRWHELANSSTAERLGVVRLVHERDGRLGRGR
jgi:photosystem II stability/assembly factor-like uncharacterized protein